MDVGEGGAWGCDDDERVKGEASVVGRTSVYITEKC